MSNIPSFYGYNVATSGLMASQAALNVVNNNISNANTAGYTEETINISEANSNGDNPSIADYEAGVTSGQGVRIQSVTRNYNNYLATTWRGQNATLQNQTTTSTVLQQIENLVPTGSGSGINQAMSDYYTQAQNVANSPNNTALRAAFLQSASSMLNTFQDTANQLQSLRTALVGDPSSPSSITSSQAGLTVADINTKLKSIATLNQQIGVITASGGQPNNLLDQRDELLDQMSNDTNVSVTYGANNQVTISLGNNTLVNGNQVVNTLQAVANPNVADQQNNPIAIELSSNSADVTSSITGGNLGAYLQVGGNPSGQTSIEGTIQMLSGLFSQIATTANTLQTNGYDLSGTQHTSDTASKLFNTSGSNPVSLFNYSTNSVLLSDPTKLAAASGTTFTGVGDGSNMQTLADSGNVSVSGLSNLSPIAYFSNQMTTLGNNVQAAQNAVTTSTALLNQTNTTRQSQQGVNIEQEMVNLLQYQRSFEASSKVLNVLDQVMNTLLTSTFT